VITNVKVYKQILRERSFPEIYEFHVDEYSFYGILVLDDVMFCLWWEIIRGNLLLHNHGITYLRLSAVGFSGTLIPARKLS
jgi:hypothetical protein